MASYRPRDPEYDDYQKPRQSGEGPGPEGYQIRGAASRRERSSHDDYRRTSDDQYRPVYRSRPFRQQEDDYYDPTVQYNAQPEEPLRSNGDKDVAQDDSTPVRFLLIRGLKSSVDVQILSKGLDKLYLDDSQAPSASQPVPKNFPGAPNMPQPIRPGAEPSSLKRVFVIRDRVSDRSMTYGFAEYFSTNDAKAALATAKSLGEKCTISSKKIEVDMPQAGIFMPANAGQAHTPDEFCFDMANGAMHVYRDLHLYAQSLTVNNEPSSRPKSPSPPKAATKLSKKRSSKALGPDVDERSGEKVKKPKNQDKQFEIAQQWQKKQAELRGDDGDDAEDAGDDITNVVHSTMPAANLESGTDNTTQSFVYQDEVDGQTRTRCLLCYTALPAKIDPVRHVKESVKHQEYLKDDAKYKQGFERLKKLGINEENTLKVKPDKPVKSAYTDRAQQRREEEARMGSTGPKINMSLKGAMQKKDAALKSGSKASDSPPAPPSYGKGLDMLRKAGYQEGQGLGAGNGRTAPIEQNMYAAGVGLGHESSKKGDAVEEARRLTKDNRGSFVEKTKDVARERFERMG